MTSALCRATAAIAAAGLIGSCGEGPVGPQPQPILAVGLEPGTASVSPTRTDTVTVEISLASTAGAVSITVSGVPAGVTATVGPVSTSGIMASAKVELSGSLAAVPGVYDLDVAASIPGAPPTMTTLRLTVAELAKVRVGNCSASDRPIWFAVQNADGTMHVVSPDTDRYRFAPEGDHAAFYYVLEQTSRSSAIRGVLRSRAELLAAPIELCEPPEPVGTRLTGRVTGMVGFETNLISFGGMTKGFWGNGGFSITSGPGTTHDLVAFKYAGPTPKTPSVVLLRRDVHVSVGDLGTLDLSAGAPGTVVPQSALMTLEDTQDRMAADVWLHSGPACRGVQLNQTAARSSHPAAYGRYWGLPTSAVADDEWHRVTVTRDPALISFDYRAVTFWTRFVEPIDIEFGPVTLPPVVERVAGAAGPRFTLDIPSAYRRTALLRFFSSEPSLFFYGSVDVSAAWFATAGTTVSVPDFSALPGWNAAWAPDHVVVSWRVTLTGGPGGVPCTAGVHDRTIAWKGML